MAFRATVLVVASGIVLSGFCLSQQTTAGRFRFKKEVRDQMPE